MHPRSNPTACEDGRVAERTVADDPASNRYELRLDGKLAGVVEYQLEGAVMTIPHVEVVPELRGKGYSAPFLDEVLQLVRDRGLKIVPLCGYARSHIRERPDLHDLLGAPTNS